jgi:hypothetical protein
MRGAWPQDSAAAGKAVLRSSVWVAARLERHDNGGLTWTTGELRVALGPGRSSGSVGSGTNEEQRASERTVTSARLGNCIMVATVRLQQPAPLGNSTALYPIEADSSWHRDIGLVGGSAHWLLGRGSAVAARVEHGTVLQRVTGELIESSQCSAWQQQLAWTPRGRRHLTSGVPQGSGCREYGRRASHKIFFRNSNKPLIWFLASEK